VHKIGHGMEVAQDPKKRKMLLEWVDLGGEIIESLNKTHWQGVHECDIVEFVLAYTAQSPDPGIPPVHTAMHRMMQLAIGMAVHMEIVIK
jgi:hypothetical protein